MEQIISEKVIGAAIEVHKQLGPGLLESSYEKCLALEFDLRGIKYKRQVLCPLNYKNIQLEDTYRIDFLIEDVLVIELKTVDVISSIHIAQVLTYLKHLKCKKGLIFNFNTTILKHGIKRVTLNSEHSNISFPN